MNKGELRIELERLKDQFEGAGNGKIMICEAQSEPIKKPWRKRQILQYKELQDELKQAEKHEKSTLRANDDKRNIQI